MAALGGLWPLLDRLGAARQQEQLPAGNAGNGQHAASLASLAAVELPKTAVEPPKTAEGIFAEDQRARLALKLGVSVSDLDRQALANLGHAVEALSHQVGDRREQRSAVETGLGLPPGSLTR